MNLFKLAAPLALAFAFAACTDGDTGSTDSGDDDTGTDTDTGPDFNDQAPEIDEILFDCDNTVAGKWWFQVRTFGWSEAGATLNIYETGAYANGTDNGWHEAGHEFSQGDTPGTDFDPNGEWDQWSLTLTPSAIGDVSPGSNTNTLYTCDTHYNTDSLAFRVYVYDDEDNDPATAGVAADCWDFGFQPEENSEIGSPDSLCVIK